jgi:hypothetical protein
MTTKGLSSICILINGLLTLTILLVFMLSSGKTPHELITRYSWALFIAVVIALITGWRSYADMRRLLSGKRSWKRPAVEGFMFGFLPVPIFHATGILQEAFAAGPPWPSFGYSSLADWIQYLFWLISMSSIFGIITAVYAMLLSGINRIALRTLADNKAISADAKNRAAE